MIDPIQHHPKWRKPWSDIIKIGKRTGLSSIPTVFQSSTQSAAGAKGQEREIKEI